MASELKKPLLPGHVIGILGGGQLGQMLAVSASRLGFICHILDPNPNCPAAKVCAKHVVAEYSDLDAIESFSKSCDVITYEFENVPAATAKSASQYGVLYPSSDALNVAQDRLVEKSFIRDVAKVPVTDFLDVTSLDSLRTSVARLGMPCILKTRRLGYDGKGQFVIKKEPDIQSAWQALNGQAAILEAFVPFVREVSVIAARNPFGAFASYPLIENIHRNQILHTSTAPAKDDNGSAQKLAKNIMDALGYIGVMATEFFELEDGTLIVNEIAPRVHNSGHWTQNAGCIDQFELHIRAICGWPLGSTRPLHTVEMTNLLGPEINDWNEYAQKAHTFIHMYGKSDPRIGRKMGHINRILNISE